ncbi:MAG: hypothetical protein WDW36_003634 [Sanguina aurantia]
MAPKTISVSKRKAAQANQTPAQASAQAESKRLKDVAYASGILAMDLASGGAAELPISKALVKANGKDITRKSSSRKNRYLMIINLQLAPAAAGRLGTLAQLDTPNPVMYIDLPQGRLKLFGTLVFPHQKYMVLKLGAGAALAEDLFESLLVFSEVWWVGTKEDNPEETRLEMPQGMEADAIHEPSDYDFAYGAARPKGEGGGRAKSSKVAAAAAAAAAVAAAALAAAAVMSAGGSSASEPSPEARRKPRATAARNSQAAAAEDDSQDDPSEDGSGQEEGPSDAEDASLGDDDASKRKPSVKRADASGAGDGAGSQARKSKRRKVTSAADAISDGGSDEGEGPPAAAAAAATTAGVGVAAAGGGGVTSGRGGPRRSSAAGVSYAGMQQGSEEEEEEEDEQEQDETGPPAPRCSAPEGPPLLAAHRLLRGRTRGAAPGVRKPTPPRQTTAKTPAAAARSTPPTLSQQLSQPASAPRSAHRKRVTTLPGESPTATQSPT